MPLVDESPTLKAEDKVKVDWICHLQENPQFAAQYTAERGLALTTSYSWLSLSNMSGELFLVDESSAVKWQKYFEVFNHGWASNSFVILISNVYMISASSDYWSGSA